MSDERRETVAEIIAEMRGADNKCQLATKDGSGCYHCPFGSAASNCLFDKYAARLEAAHKRETSKICPKTGGDFGQLGNAAKLREALVDVYNTLEKLQPYALHINDISVRRAFRSMLCHAKNAIDAALAAPPRNCDVGTAEEQAERYAMFVKRHWTLGKTALQWAQMPYEEEEGGAK